MKQVAAHHSTETDEEEAFPPPMRSHWVRAETLRGLRWIAIAGQTATVLFAQFVIGFDLPLIACFVAILASVWFNMVAGVTVAPNAGLSEGAALGWLLFDAVQLATLLSMTGGLSNPFSLLFIAPAAIASTALSPWAARVAMLACILLICLLEWVHLPLRLANGDTLTLPPIYRAGVWCALLVGVAFIAVYVRRVTREAFHMSQALGVTQLALAREQRLSALGAMAAAAGHELGTPLATIALTAKEMRREVEPETELAEDLELIREQTERCRGILAQLAQIRRGDMEHIRTAPLLSVLKEAAAPHSHEGKRLRFIIDGEDADEDDTPSPEIERRPELIHGFRNLIQNAVDFAAKEVTVAVVLEPERIVIRVEDDGPGFSADVMEKIGRPFMTTRRGRRGGEGGYEGMGLGVFIAKTLLERCGGRIAFLNRNPRHRKAKGAMVETVWRRDALQVD